MFQSVQCLAMAEVEQTVYINCSTLTANCKLQQHGNDIKHTFSALAYAQFNSGSTEKHESANKIHMGIKHSTSKQHSEPNIYKKSSYPSASIASATFKKAAMFAPS